MVECSLLVLVQACFLQVCGACGHNGFVTKAALPVPVAYPPQDPTNMIKLLQQYPWHADTLLQVSEYYKHREGLRLCFRIRNDRADSQLSEHSSASDFVERAIFAYERALTPFNFTLGVNRLDFDQVENRAFFLALHRHIVYAPDSFRSPYLSHSHNLSQESRTKRSLPYCIRMRPLAPQP